MTRPNARRPRSDRTGATARRPRRSTDGARAGRAVDDRVSTPPGSRTGPGRRTRLAAAAGPAALPAPARPGSSRLARQVVILGIVLCAVALSLAYPLRNYLDQRAALAATVAEQRTLEQQLAGLQQQQAALTDPDYLRQEAKHRLQYVIPGDTVYVVQAPPLPAPDADAISAAQAAAPWYETLWNTLAAPAATP